jgi:hypothetical protein
VKALSKNVVNKDTYNILLVEQDKEQMDNSEDQEIFEKEIDQDALDVNKRLYDNPFKELVDR